MSDDKRVWKADNGDGSYSNPVLHADYSDPDPIRVGDDFFLVSSSFSHFPGLPLLHSRDLVNWRIANHVAQRLDAPGYAQPRHGCGIWAPSIRYRDGKFLVFFGDPDEGIYLVRAEDPFGDWSEPLLVKAARGWIDPCPFWDEDGRAYLVHAFARSRSGIKHRLDLCAMAPDGTRLLDEGRTIFEDPDRHPTMEGPKMYKRGGWYYVFAPAGGVKPGWQVVLRSRAPYGPYEDRIVLRQGGSEVNGPHQGGWVELPSGESWLLHFQDKGAYGRVVHLQPMRWEGGWPLMGSAADRAPADAWTLAEGAPVDAASEVRGEPMACGEPVARHAKPKVGASCPLEEPATSDDFRGPRLGLQWQWQANPRPEGWLSLSARPGRLRLFAASLPGPTLYEAPNLLLQKFPAPAFSAATELEFSPDEEGDRAGLVVFGERYACLELRRERDGQNRLSLVLGEPGESAGSGPASRAERELASVAVAGEAPIGLRVRVGDGASCDFEYRLDGGPYRPIGESFAAVPGAWVGAKVGVYAAGAAGGASAGHADFGPFVVAAGAPDRTPADERGSSGRGAAAASSSDALCESKAIAAGMDALFDGFYSWLAARYDPASGGFWYAASSPSLPGAEPDIESSAQALSVLERSGLLGGLGKPMLDRMTSFFQRKQDAETGLFLDRDPAMRKDEVMVGRAMGYATRALASLGAGPLRHLPSPSLAPEYMASPESYVAWLRGVDLRSAWRGCDLMMSANHYLERLPPREARAFVEAAATYFASIQDPATGLWGGGGLYTRLSGAFKMNMFYRRFGLPMPRAEAIYRSALRCLEEEEALDMCWIRNPLDLLDSFAGRVRPSAGELAGILAATARNMARLKRPDGGFSRELRGSPVAPNVAQVKEGESYPDMPEPVRLGRGLVEGDMNAATQALLVRRIARELAGLRAAPPPSAGEFARSLGGRGPSGAKLPRELSSRPHSK